MGGSPSSPGVTDDDDVPARAKDSRGRSASRAGGGERVVWGVLNVTPDSFSDGGRHDDLEAALAHAERLRGEGADVIDVGGESSRPPGRTYGAGALRVPVGDELARVVPVVEALVGRAMRVSVDTVKAEVARASLAAGAEIINDVSCGADPALLDAVADAGAELVLMHTRGGGRIDATTTRYVDVVADVVEELEAAALRAVARGIARERLWLDPGLGFAKTPAQSICLLGNLDALVARGYPVLVGASRKSFIARTLAESGAREPAPMERLGGSVACVAAAALAGAAAVRVHDVAESVQAWRVASAMRAARAGRA